MQLKERQVKLRYTYKNIQPFIYNNIHTSIIKRKSTKMCSVVELYTYCSMNKQYVKGVKNGKRFT